jgi:hypothetical protein
VKVIIVQDSTTQEEKEWKKWVDFQKEKKANKGAKKGQRGKKKRTRSEQEKKTYKQKRADRMKGQMRPEYASEETETRPIPDMSGLVRGR